jgi:hypothetical protein
MFAIMKQSLGYAVLICILSIVACQREISWNITSEGTLQKDSVGNCMPVAVNGSFIVNKPVNDSNFLIITLNITLPGDYSVTTDKINGYSFNAAGSFKDTGSISLKMLCSGMPLLAGTDKFTIRYNGSNCEAFVTVSPDTIAVADYTLQDSSGNCISNTVIGSYLEKTMLDTSNKVGISVDVITPGTYSISTDTVNGYSFKASGIFATAGIQTVFLYGNGTPFKTGDDIFTVSANASTCNFPVHVAKAVIVNSQHYFPLTDGSYWTYINPIKKDTVKRFINGDTLVKNTTFIRMSETEKNKQQNYYYNFDGMVYTEFTKVDKYNSSFYYDPPIYGSLPFLRESLNPRDSWESDEFKGKASFGQILFFKYHYNCTDTGLAITVNGFGFKNVNLVEVHPMVKSEFGAYGATNEVFFLYYAKGIGIVYEKVRLVGGDPYPILGIIDWHVN